MCRTKYGELEISENDKTINRKLSEQEMMLEPHILS